MFWNKKEPKVPVWKLTWVRAGKNRTLTFHVNNGPEATAIARDYAANPLLSDIKLHLLYGDDLIEVMEF